MAICFCPVVFCSPNPPLRDLSTSSAPLFDRLAIGIDRVLFGRLCPFPRIGNAADDRCGCPPSSLSDLHVASSPSPATAIVADLCKRLFHVSAIAKTIAGASPLVCLSVCLPAVRAAVIGIDRPAAAVDGYPGHGPLLLRPWRPCSPRRPPPPLGAPCPSTCSGTRSGRSQHGSVGRLNNNNNHYEEIIKYMLL